MPQGNVARAPESAKTLAHAIPASEILHGLRLTCRLLTLHPWFGKGTRIPREASCEPVGLEDLERLVEELSYVTRLVCLHREHADSHRDAFLQLLGQIVATLSSPAIESNLVELIGQSDGLALERKLANLRRLVIDSARNDNTHHQRLTIR